MSQKERANLNRAVSNDVAMTMGFVGGGAIESKYGAASLYLQTMGFGKLLKSINRMQSAKLAAAWNSWLDAVSAHRRHVAQEAFVKKHSAATMWQRFVDASLRVKKTVWGAWTRLVFALRMEEDRETNEAAAITMQRGTRGHAARQEMRRRRARREAETRRAAATTMQTRCRGRLAKKRGRLLKEERRVNRAATRIQACARARLSRAHVAEEARTRARLVLRGLTQNASSVSRVSRARRSRVTTRRGSSSFCFFVTPRVRYARRSFRPAPSTRRAARAALSPKP